MDSANQNACILVCGLERSYMQVIETLERVLADKKISTHFILCLDINSAANLDKCIHKTSICKTILLPNRYADDYRNSLNYSDKIKCAIENIDRDKLIYDYYILVRSDSIIESVDLSKLEDDVLYFTDKKMNQFINSESQLDDSIIITKSEILFKSLANIHSWNVSSTDYFNKVLYRFVKESGYTYKYLHIDFKYILSRCNVIAIAGDSGSGKSTLLKALEPLFDERVILETDRYHKWERGDENYKKYTHLNPYANHLEKMVEDVYNLKVGNDIYQVDYDHTTGKFTQKQKIESKTNIVLCGLHTLYKNINQLADLKIYVDTDRELIKKWKLKRDVEERGYPVEKVLKNMQVREPDYHAYILPQKQEADIIVHFSEKQDTQIQTYLDICNETLSVKIGGWLSMNGYPIEYIDGNMRIYLKNNTDIMKNTLVEKYALYRNSINNYYCEIITILFFILF